MCREDAAFRTEVARLVEDKGRDAGAVGICGSSSAQLKVVYAIIARWNRRNLSQALPLFSKLTLWSYVRELQGRSVDVRCNRVEVREE